MAGSYALPDEANPEHRCLWCGKRLKQRIAYPEAERPRWDHALINEENLAREKAWEAQHRIETGEYGQYRDNAFCKLACSHGFGLAAARAGYRMVARKVDR